MRIVSVLESWEGSNSYAFLRAFRRLGHSVVNIDPAKFVPTSWRRRRLRAARRMLEPTLIHELAEAVIDASRSYSPTLFFTFKGAFVSPEAVMGVQNHGAVAIDYYPDVSFTVHGRNLLRALPCYDWIFTTKSFGVADLQSRLGIAHAEFLPHGFDPEVHAPIEVDEVDRARYGCDVSFIGTWSPKKQELLEVLVRRMPDVDLRIWGAQWGRAAGSLDRWTEGRPVLGREYAKALVCSKVNLGLLSEIRPGASSGDLITSRTFHIPATGSFMLHERSTELVHFFTEGEECGAFADGEELVEKVQAYLGDDHRRRAVALAGRERSLRSDYSIDARAKVVVERALALSGSAVR